MQVTLRLFLDWGITFGKPYEVPEQAQRPVAYASRKELEMAIYKSTHPEELESAPAPSIVVQPAPQDDPQRTDIAITEYQPTNEIQRMTNEINRQLDSENPDKEKVEALIIMCAQLKYTTINEVKT